MLFPPAEFQQAQEMRQLNEEPQTLIWGMGMFSMVGMSLAFFLNMHSPKAEWPYKFRETWPVDLNAGRCMKYCKLKRRVQQSWAVNLRCRCDTNVTGDGEDGKGTTRELHFHGVGGIGRASLEDELAVTRTRYAEAHDCLGLNEGEAKEGGDGHCPESWCPSLARCVRALWEPCPEGTMECQEWCPKWAAVQSNATVNEVDGSVAFPCRCDNMGHALDFVPGVYAAATTRGQE